MEQCPPDFRPVCCCRILDLEPRENCPIHGWPDRRRCPYCNAFRAYGEPCKRCGCSYGLQGMEATDGTKSPDTPR